MSTLSGQTDIDQVRSATNLVALIGEHVSLRSRGREHIGLCPFHDDKNPSLAVVTHKGNAFYKCHSCGAAGDCFNFVMEYHKRTFGEALKFLAERAGITLTPRAQPRRESSGPDRAAIRAANAFAADFFQFALKHPVHGQVGRDILARRQITPEIAAEFGLGLSLDQWDALVKSLTGRQLDLNSFEAAGLVMPRKQGEGHYDRFRNRLMFPICDDLGHPIAFGGRQIKAEDDPKYLNSPESPLFHKSSSLYAIHLAKRAIIEKKTAIVVEGYVDAIACHQAGVRNVVATLGTALTAEHARILSRLCETVVLVFDGDEAGQKAADRAVEVFFSEPVDLRICVLPGEVDPDDLLKQEGGREQFDQAVTRSQDALKFKVRRFRDRLKDAASSTARATRLEAFLQELAELGFGQLQGVRKRLILNDLADMLDIPLRELERAIPARRQSAAAPPPTMEPALIEASGSDEALIDSALPAISADRRRAESDLLSILIFEPDVARHSVAFDGAQGPFIDVVSLESFLDQRHRRIAQAMLTVLHEERALTVQHLMSELADPSLNSLAAELFDQGSRQCGQTVEAAQAALAAACRSLESVRGREQFRSVAATVRSEASADHLAFTKLIKHRRDHGHNPVAIPRGVRS